MKGYEAECPLCQFVSFERSQQAADYMIDVHLSAHHKLYGKHRKQTLDE